MNIRNLMVFCVLFFLGSSAFASYIIVEAEKITDIKVSPMNTDSFAVKTTGVDDCAGQWVVFSLENFPSPAAYDRAYSMALSAISVGQEIYIAGNTESDCSEATTIAILN